MSILNRFARKWFQRNQGCATRIPLPMTKPAPRLETLEGRVVPTITFNYGVLAPNVLGMNGNASADQFTLTNDTTKYYISSDSTLTFGNDATLDASSVSTPPKQTVGGLPASTNIAFDNTVLLALNPGSGSDFWLDQNVNAVLLSGGGKISSYPFGTGDYTITITGLTASANYAGKIINGGLGSLALTMNQPGATQILSGSNAYTGATKVVNGNLTVNGSLNAASAVSVSGGALKGTGTVGNVTLTGGSLAPGDATGTLNTANLSFNASSKFAASFKGASLYSAAKVTGTVNLGGAALTGSFIGGFAPTSGTQFTLINNDGADKITGSFAGLPEGSTVTLSSNQFTISYVGGDGNDVVLTAQASTKAPAITSANNTAFDVGSLGTFTVTTTGIPTSTISESGALPSGVTFTDNGDGTATLSGTPAAGTVGTYPITFTASNGISPNATQNFTLTVNQASTSSLAALTVSPVVVGQTFQITAAVSAVAPGAGVPTGSVRFFFGPTQIASATLSGGVATSPNISFALSGTGQPFSFVYDGDANFVTSTSNTVFQDINKFNTVTTVVSSANPSVFGQSVTFTSTTSVSGPGSGNRNGTVEFYAGATMLGTATSNNAGVATFSTSSLPASSAQITAKYLGNAISNGSTSSELTQVVNKASTTTVNVSSINPSVVGQSFNFTATVSPVAPGAGTPTGSVQLFINGGAFGIYPLVGGTVSIPLTGNQTGSLDLRLDYLGDTEFDPSTGNTITQVINKFDTTTVVSSSTNPSVFGQSITFTATVSVSGPGAGARSGIVEFYAGASLLGMATADSSGIATLSTSNLPVGSAQITASYLGNAFFANGSTSTAITQVVDKADTTTVLVSDVNPSLFGQSVTFTATVAPVAPGAGVPTGQVTFLSSGVPLGVGTLVGGVATLSTSALTVGANSITVEYAGDSGFNTSTSGNLTQDVNQATTTTTLKVIPNPSTYGDLVTLSAQVDPIAPGAGLPTGIVLFLDNGSLIGVGAVNATGEAIFGTFDLSGGNHNLSAIYVGDGNFIGSNSPPVSQTVNQAVTSTNLTSDINPSLFGQSVTFTAVVTGVPTGLFPTGVVDFSVNGGLPVSVNLDPSGVATWTTSSLNPGISSVVATYLGDGNYLGSASTPLDQTVNQAPFFTSVATTTFQTNIFGIYSITAGGYPTNINFTTSGTLPNGVSLASDGTLFGTPAPGTGGQYDFTVDASNGILPDAHQNFSLIVNQPPEFTNADNVTFQYGVPANFQFVSTGYPTTFTYTVNSGSLPSGLTLDTDGLLHGTVNPGVFGTFPIQVKSSNGVLPDAFQNFTITVQPTGALYYLDSVTNELTISLADDVDLDFSELVGVTTFSIAKPGELPFFVAAPGSSILPGEGTSAIQAKNFAGLTINNSQTLTDLTDNDIKFSLGRVTSNFLKIDIAGHKGSGTTDFFAGTSLNLSGDLDITANNNVTLDGDLLISAYRSKKGYDHYRTTLSGSSVQMGLIQLDNGGAVTLGDQKTDNILIANGVTVTTETFAGGTISTNSGAISLNALSLLSDTVLNTLASGLGSSISLTGGLTQNGYSLTTYAASSSTTTMTGNLNLNGPLYINSGGLGFGDGVTPTVVTLLADTVISGNHSPINFASNTLFDVGTHSAFFISDSIGIDPGTLFQGTGNLGFSPFTNSLPIFLGAAAPSPLPGLQFGSGTLAQFPASLNSVQFGAEGYSGTIQIGQATVFNRLDLLTNGGGGKVKVTGPLTITGGDANGVGLHIGGSGHTTVLAADIITAGAAIIIDDAVQVAANVALDTTNGGAVPAGADVILTGGTAGIYSSKGFNYNLAIQGGTTGDVTLGAFRGFGNSSNLGSLVKDLTITADQVQLPQNANQLAGDVSLHLSPTGSALFESILTTAGGLFVNNGATWQLGGALNVAGPVIQVGTTKVSAGANINAGKGVILSGPLSLLTNSTIRSEGIHLSSVDGLGNNLTLNGNPNGVHSVIGVTGTISNVNSLVIQGSESVTLDQAVTANSLALSDMKAATLVSFADNLTVAGGLTANPGSYNLTLNGSSNTIGPVSLLNAGTLNLGNSKVDQTLFTGSAALAGKSLSVNIQGAVVSQGDLTLFGWASGNSAEPITLAANNIFLFGGNSAGGLDISAQGGVNIQGGVNGGNTNIGTGTNFTLNAPLNVTGNFIFEGGSISQGTDGGLTVTGRSAFAATGDIYLNSQNILTQEVQFTGRNVTIDNVPTLNFKIWTGLVPPALASSADSLVANSALGNITNVDPIFVKGSSSFTASVGNITLTGGNELDGPVDFLGGNVSISSLTGLNLHKGSATGDLTLNTRNPLQDQNLGQSGPLTVGNGIITLDAGTANIVLTNPLNNFGSKSLVNLNAGNASLTVASGIQLDLVNVPGVLSVEAGLSITQDRAITVGSVDLVAGGDISLTNISNIFGSISVDSKNAEISVSGALALGTIEVPGSLTIVTGGDITQTGSLLNNGPLAEAYLLSQGNINLPHSGNDFRFITANANNFTITDSNTLDLLNCQILGTATINAGQDLYGDGNEFVGNVDLVASGFVDFGEHAPSSFGGTVSFAGTEVYLFGIGDIILDGCDASISLDVISTGNISQNGVTGFGYLSVSGESKFTAAGDINLNDPRNQLTGPVAADGVNITIVNATSTVLGAITASGTLDVYSTGFGIAQSDILAVTGLATLDADSADILLGMDNKLAQVNLTGHDITLHNTQNLALAGVQAYGHLNLSANGTLTQSSPVLAQGPVDLIAAQSILLNNPANQFHTTVNAESIFGEVVISATTHLFGGEVRADTDIHLTSAQNIYVEGEFDAVDTYLSGAGDGSNLRGTVIGSRVIWDGPGTLRVSGFQSLSSELRVANGDVELLGDNLIHGNPALNVLDNALFYMDGHSQTFGGLNGGGSVVLGSLGRRGTLVIDNTIDALFSGVISSHGDLFKTGTGLQVFNNTNTFDGFTEVDNGTLQLGDTISNGSVADTVYIGEGTLTFRPGSDQSFPNTIISTGGFTTTVGNIVLDSPNGANLEISGNNLFFGKTTILEGTLDVHSNLGPVVVNGADAVLTGYGFITQLDALQGTVAPGKVAGTGTLQVTGQTTLGAASTLLVYLQSDVLFGDLNSASTNLQGGSIVVQVDPAYTPPDLQPYKVISGGAVTGKFSQGSIVTSGPYYFRVNYNPDDVTLQKVPAGVFPGAKPLVVAPGVGQSNAVVYDSNNQERSRVQPMGSWTGGMRTAVGDVTGDGFADYIFAAQSGGGPRVVVLDGVTLDKVSSFYAYTPTFLGGLYVAAGDINGDGIAEIVTGAGATGGPHVQAFNVSGVNTGTSFFAYTSTFTGGVTVATGDINGDGFAEIITGAASNGGSHVRSFNADGSIMGLNFFAYAPSFLGGVNVAAGDIDGDGKAEVITGAGATGGPNVKFFDGNGNQLTSFFSYLPSFTGGVTVGAIDPTNSGTFNIVTGPASMSAYPPGPRVNLYKWTPPVAELVTNILVYNSTFNGGVWVA